MKQIFAQVVTFLIVFVVTLSTFSSAVFAVNYGEGRYGEGTYNQGEQPTPLPTSNPGSGSSGSGSSGSSASNDSLIPGPCTDTVPGSSPDLFQMNPRTDGVTLYFAPSSSPRDGYTVSYGTQQGADQYAFEFTHDSSGVISVDVNALAPTTTYYFKVRASNGCMPGDWSNVLQIKTGQRWPAYRWASLMRIASTAVSQVTNPASISKVETTTSETSIEQANSTDNVSVSTGQDTSNSAVGASNTQTQSQQQPGFWQRLSNFVKGIFGR